jgi:HEAT repeat protein
MRYLSTMAYLLSVAFVLCLSSDACGSLSDDLVSKLQRDNWEELFYHKGEIHKYKTGENFRALVEVVQNKGLEWPVRIRGIRLLSKTNNIAAPDILIGMLYDPFINHECPAIKSSVAEALGNFHKDHRVVDALLYSLNDGEILVREAAVDSLGKIGSNRAVPALLRLLNDRSVAIRIATIKALGRIGDPSVMGALKLVANNDISEEVKYTARETLGMFSR